MHRHFSDRRWRIALMVTILGVLAAMLTLSPTTLPEIKNVTISGYDGDVMEPFITRDGKYLLFNNLNTPGTNTDIFFAERKDDLTWTFKGPVAGINTPELEGCPTLDKDGKMYFISPRSYGQTYSVIYTGQFKDGTVTGVQLVDSISKKELGIVNFDVDVSADGKMLVYVDSRFENGGITYAKLMMADWDGSNFVPEKTNLLDNVNTGKLQYAPTISSDKLTLYFTRYDPASPAYQTPQIWMSHRASLLSAFPAPEHVDGTGDYVEGSCLSPDEKSLYFHRKDGSKFCVHCMKTPTS